MTIVEKIVASQRELVKTSIQQTGFEPCLITAFRSRPLAQNPMFPKFLDASKIDAAHCVRVSAITCFYSILTISDISKYLVLLPDWKGAE